MKTLAKIIALLVITISVNAQNTIESIQGYTPQIGIMVSMLDDMKVRVERTVMDLNTEQLDYLMDDQANRIGALIMHLAATEAFYQVYTFEGREFNEKEEKEWGTALSLGDAAREKYRGYDVNYYLDAYTKVRIRTLELFKEKDDAWFAALTSNGNMNNHWAWYHVMEHQSSHLGQILLLKKRVPNN
jgi:uncharacterized damage-inducible protein DinB